jgi:hypothetical protein
MFPTSISPRRCNIALSSEPDQKAKERIALQFLFRASKSVVLTFSGCLLQKS